MYKELVDETFLKYMLVVCERSKNDRGISKIVNKMMKAGYVWTLDTYKKLICTLIQHRDLTNVAVTEDETRMN